MKRKALARPSERELDQLGGSQPAKGEKTARRVLRLLDFVSRQAENVSAKAIAHHEGVSLPTAYNLINSLIKEGYVERVPERKGYRLGPMIPLLYKRSLSKGDLVSQIEPVIEELAEKIGQRTYLAFYQDSEVMIADTKHVPGSPKIPEVVAGFRDAEHALALGKILLADLPEEEMKAFADERVLEAFTSRTITDPRRLDARLDQVRSEEYATDLEEFAEGFCCIAAPVRGPAGDVEAAIGISSLSRRFRAEFAFFARSVLQAGKDASSIRGGGIKRTRGTPKARGDIHESSL
jgi:DNA-binding IclR family transcriptional regulator